MNYLHRPLRGTVWASNFTGNSVQQNRSFADPTYTPSVKKKLEEASRAGQKKISANE
ncbi:hypothetical protein V0288_15980 [Pannus brasiliensis CCIBt3594]|uniref:Uncharacterized protein n=1 Tax=Pannus brasiliensis CCIBt3594 TaxID=1427578 RepID=A0AAW9QLG1_9CHRO